MKSELSYCCCRELEVGAPELEVVGETTEDFLTDVSSAPDIGRVAGMGGGIDVDFDRDAASDVAAETEAGAPDSGPDKGPTACDGARPVDCGRVRCEETGVDAAPGRRLLSAGGGRAPDELRARSSAAACCSASCRVRSTSTSTYTVRRDSLLFASFFFFFFSFVPGERSVAVLSGRVLPSVAVLSPKSKSA